MTRTRSRTRTRPQKSGKKVTIDRTKRRQLHAVWPSLVIGPLYRVASDIRYQIRQGTWGEGLTPKEKDYLYETLHELDAASKKLIDFYYKRLKY